MPDKEFDKAMTRLLFAGVLFMIGLTCLAFWLLARGLGVR
jgi:heme/copper-type cytochrome/quinol oxidase subunit 4